jgi:excisionase family DNA binding protein
MSPAGASLRLMTAEEVAEILGVSRAYVYNEKWRIGFVKLGRVIRFRLEAVESFLAAHTESIPDQIGKIEIR